MNEDGGREGTVLDAEGQSGLSSVRFIVSLAFLIASVTLVLNGWPGMVPPIFEGLSHRLVGSLGTLWFSFTGYWSLRSMLDRAPRLSVSDEGILNRTLWFSPTWIAWEEIVDVRPRAWPGLREIVLRDPAGWLERQPWSVRMWSRYTRLLGLGPVCLNLWSVVVDWDELDRVVEAASQAAELRSYPTAIGGGGEVDEA